MTTFSSSRRRWSPVLCRRASSPGRRCRVGGEEKDVDSVGESGSNRSLPWYLSVGTRCDLSFEVRHAGAHDLVDEKEIRGDHRAGVEKLNFDSEDDEKQEENREKRKRSRGVDVLTVALET